MVEVRHDELAGRLQHLLLGPGRRSATRPGRHEKLVAGALRRREVHRRRICLVVVLQGLPGAVVSDRHVLRVFRVVEGRGRLQGDKMKGLVCGVASEGEAAQRRGIVMVVLEPEYLLVRRLMDPIVLACRVLRSDLPPRAFLVLVLDRDSRGLPACALLDARLGQEWRCSLVEREVAVQVQAFFPHRVRHDRR